MKLYARLFGSLLVLQYLFIKGQVASFDIALDLEALRGLLDPYRGLIVVLDDAISLDLRFHLHGISSCAWCL